MNADIGRQFEFIQNFWVNNPKFEGLVNDRDPITGNHSNPDSRRTKGTFTVQDDKLRNRYHDLPEFVTVKGGAYFFLPGLKALKYLTTI
ncbi:MAG: peroxidase, partial [Ignavibacteria bacterium]|nr:peroxidase [Ignavibacteria bacterium]